MAVCEAVIQRALNPAGPRPLASENTPFVVPGGEGSANQPGAHPLRCPRSSFFPVSLSVSPHGRRTTSPVCLCLRTLGLQVQTDGFTVLLSHLTHVRIT